MAVRVNRITNANVYLNGVSLLGRVEEIKLPDIVSKMMEHKALGMVGTIELPSGIEKLEGEVKFSSFYRDVMIAVGNPFEFAQLQVRSNVETYSAQGRTTQAPLVTFLTVSFKKNPCGAFKQHDNAEFASGYACNYIKQVMDGADVLEIDVLSNIYKIDGVDILSLYRTNLGA